VIIVVLPGARIPVCLGGEDSIKQIACPEPEQGIQYQIGVCTIT